MIFANFRACAAFILLSFVLGKGASIAGEVAPDSGQAESEEQYQFDELEEEFLLLQDEDIVLAPSKHSQKIEASPAAVVVITRRTIEESGATCLFELLRRYPALHVYEFGPAYPTVMIRGTIRVLVRVDGREMNIELFPAPFYAFLPIDLEDIERIEIVLGPNSALYGANAVSAVIDITTRKPDRRFALDAGLSGGEHGRFKAGGRVAGSAGPFLLQAAARMERASSWTDPGKVALEVFRGLFSADTQIGQHLLRADAAFVTGSGYTYSVIGDMELGSVTFLNAGLGWQWKGFKARAWWYALRADFELKMDLYHPSTGIELARIPPFSLAGDTAQLEVEYEHSFWDERLLLMAGADGRGTWYRSSQLVDPHVEEYRLGVFFHGELQPLEWLRLTLGGRFDYNTVTPPAFSPRGALVFDLGRGQTLRLSAGTAFRKPTLLETSSNFRIEADPAFADEMRYLFEEKGISNPALDNEELTGFELGWRGDFLDRRLRATVDVYFNMNRRWVNFVNDIRFRPPPFQMQIDLQNSRIGYENSGADYNLLGIHGSVQIEPLEDLSLFVRGEWRHEWRVSGDGAEVQTAPWQVAAGGTWKLPFESVLDIAVAHVAARKDYVVNPKSALLPVIWTTLPPVTIVMASWRYALDLSSGRLELGISAFNPFGGRFREKAGVVDASGTNFGGELLGRSVMLTARWKAD